MSQNEKNDKSVAQCCTICLTPWKVTCFGAKKWRDCLKCGETEEEILTKYKKSEKNTLNSDDLLKEFEKMLEDSDNDDFELDKYFPYTF